ncbi:MAG: leucine-rich repeat domain-containing protein, partial [Ruminococcus sp.]|nr:leucine-rich repeat domain-containing protein [Ruminococcus sp.]
QILTSITIPNSVTSIGNYAFWHCLSLTSIIIPDSVTSIGEYAFSDCQRLTSITIPDSVTSIGEYAFESCDSLKNIDVSEKNNNFCSCYGVLYNKDMTILIKYPEAKQATEFIIPNSVTSIDEKAFYFCKSLTSITIPDSVTSIGKCAFWNCTSLTSVTIPDSVTSIGKCAFWGCTSLTSITIPDSIKFIYEDAFPVNKKIIICKGDVKVPFILKDRWNINKQERLLNDFIVAVANDRQQYFDKLEAHYKLPLAIFMVFAYPQESSYYLDYLKRNKKKAVNFIIDEENIDLLYKFLELGFVTKKNIDSLISYAVEHTQNGGSAEPQLVLSKYKSDNFSSKGADAMDKFML